MPTNCYKGVESVTFENNDEETHLRGEKLPSEERYKDSALYKDIKILR